MNPSVSSAILSPVTGSANCRKIKSYNPEALKTTFWNDLKIDVSGYFKNVEVLELWECGDTGLRFFVPDTILGEGTFYEELQQFDWYYLPWKWEHEQTLRLLPSSGNLLEIGCAEGGFLKAVKEKGLQAEGIELNQGAAAAARSKGLAVSELLLSDYLKAGNQERFDYVCSFQVLEHISDVRGFIQDALACLKPGGRLFISVPNMDTFLRYDDGGILNFPPHHQGWYTDSVFQRFESYFPVRLDGVEKEPLQQVHFQWFHRNMMTKYYNRAKWMGSLYFRTLNSPAIRQRVFTWLAPGIHGHTMMAIFTKTKG